MATFFPLNGSARQLPTPLTLTTLQTCVGGFIRFIDLPSGDIMVVNEASPDLAELNETASSLANRDVFGDVVLCEPEELA